MTATFSGQMTMSDAAGKMTLSLIGLNRSQQNGGFVKEDSRSALLSAARKGIISDLEKGF